MTKFKIPITWEVCGEIEIEAVSLEEAIKAVDFDPDEITVPEEWEIVEGSIIVTDFEMAEVLNPGYKMSEEFPVRELEAKGFGIQEKESQKVEEVCDGEEREARRHLDQLGEGYQEDTEEEGGDEEG